MTRVLFLTAVPAMIALVLAALVTALVPEPHLVLILGIVFVAVMLSQVLRLLAQRR